MTSNHEVRGSNPRGSIFCHKFIYISIVFFYLLRRGELAASQSSWTILFIIFFWPFLFLFLFFFLIAVVILFCSILVLFCLIDYFLLVPLFRVR